MKAVRPVLEIQNSWSAIPNPDELLIERTTLRDGTHHFIFPFAGRLVHEGLSALLAHRIAQRGAGGGIDGLGASMLLALLVVTPIGLAGALPAATSPLLLGAGVGVGICSSVIPYVTDQLAMARLSRGTYALLLSLLPAAAASIGVVVLRQLPTTADLAGIALVVVGIAVHRERPS